MYYKSGLKGQNEEYVMEVSRLSGYVVNLTVDQKVRSLNPTVALMSLGKTPSTFATLDQGDVHVSGYLAGLGLGLWMLAAFSIFRCWETYI